MLQLFGNFSVKLQKLDAMKDEHAAKPSVLMRFSTCFVISICPPAALRMLEWKCFGRVKTSNLRLERSALHQHVLEGVCDPNAADGNK